MPQLTRDMTVAQARRVLADAFRRAGLDSPELDARLLVGHALGLDHTALTIDSGRRLGDDAARTLAEFAARRLDREPADLKAARRSAEWIVEDANRASEVIRRIRALAKKTEIEVVALDINQVVREAVALVRRELATHRVSVRMELASNLPKICGDRIQLQQVLINLVMNGIEAMAGVSEQRRRLAVRSRLGEGQVLVAVQDAGTGIDPQNANRLFSAFYTTKSNGMGMGLSISRSIVEAHGGRIRATNNDGPGATIEFTVPFAEDSRA